MYFLWYILIGLVAGYVAGVLAVGTIGSLFTAVIGSIVLLWIVALLSPRKRR